MFFRQGDTIKCIDGSGNSYIREGNLYVALEDANTEGVRILNDGGYPYRYGTSRFELANGEETVQEVAVATVQEVATLPLINLSVSGGITKITIEGKLTKDQINVIVNTVV